MEVCINEKMMYMVVERLGRAGIKALLFLYKYGRNNAYQIIQKAGMSTGATKGVLLQLVNMGLVKQEEGRGIEILYSLTEKGKKVAEHLNAVEELLSDST
ncbi:MAG: winged helix-turn-helix domain-containing protein [Candidatus Methanomethylicaceae archaeon]